MKFSSPFGKNIRTRFFRVTNVCLSACAHLRDLCLKSELDTHKLYVFFFSLLKAFSTKLFLSAMVIYGTILVHY